MDIAPIAGIRIFSPGSGSKAGNAVPRFEIDSSARTRDETYSPSSETPDRGLEDENAETGEEEESSSEVIAAEEAAGPQIDIVA
jgi:hypothetical protein